MQAWLKAKSEAKHTFAKGACNNMKFNLKHGAHWRGCRSETKPAFSSLSHNSTEELNDLMLNRTVKSKLVPEFARLNQAYATSQRGEFGGQF